MSNLVERLKRAVLARHSWNGWKGHAAERRKEVADAELELAEEALLSELTRLRAEVEALKGAAKPFAEYSKVAFCGDKHVDGTVENWFYSPDVDAEITVGDFRRLATLAQETTDERK